MSTSEFSINRPEIWIRSSNMTCCSFALMFEILFESKIVLSCNQWCYDMQVNFLETVKLLYNAYLRGAENFRSMIKNADSSVVHWILATNGACWLPLVTAQLQRIVVSEIVTMHVFNQPLKFFVILIDEARGFNWFLSWFFFQQEPMGSCFQIILS